MLNELAKLDTLSVAQWLLGKKLIRELDGQILSGIIVETEAYLHNDLAAHSYNGPTRRNAVMFGPPGSLYVYFTYGMHYCINVVTGPARKGEAVLIRALEPMEGMVQMKQLRKQTNVFNLTNGPAKLAQALAIDKDLNGHILERPPTWLQVGQPVKKSDIVQTTRVGITKSVNLPYRFYLKNSSFVSRK